MSLPDKPIVQLPTPGQIKRAIGIYLQHAYEADLPGSAGKLLPPDSFEPRQWLMSGLIERDPPDSPLEQVRSFALRLGNSHYPHMKLRLSRPPREAMFVFSVDCHDAILKALPGTPDYEALEELKRANAAMAQAISVAMDAAALPTEHSYLRQRLAQAKARKNSSSS